MKTVEIIKSDLFKVGDIAVCKDVPANSEAYIVTEIKPNDVPNVQNDKMTVVALSGPHMGTSTAGVYQHFFIKLSGSITITQ